MINPLEATKNALHLYAVSVPNLALAAQASEALRLLTERASDAEVLFNTDAPAEKPTEKQITLLRRIGYKGIVLSKRHASDLIQQRIGKKGGAK